MSGRILALLGCGLLVAGCASVDRRIPVSNAGERAEAGVRHHRVQKGETLYAIAWNYGLDYRDLATENRIPAPYTIYVDQRLKLPAPRGEVRDGAPPAQSVDAGPVDRTVPAPRAPPPGYSMGAHTRMVPRLVPVAVETMAEMRKAPTT